jgi:hypothetical protein
MMIEKKIDSLSNIERFRDLSIEFKRRADLVKGTNDFKKKLELIAEGCYLLSGVQLLADFAKVESLIAHERNMGRVTPEVEEWLSQVKKKFSGGAPSTSVNYLKD